MNDKTTNFWNLIFSGSLLLSAMICMIVNYAIERAISWSLFPLGGMLVLWAMTTPMLILKKNKLAGLFLGLSASVLPYLFLIEHLVSTKGWFLPLALPITLLALAAFGSILLLTSLVKINYFYGMGVTVFLFGAVVNYGVSLIVGRYLNNKNIFFDWNTHTILASMVLASILLVAGFLKSSRKDSNQ